MKHNNSTRALTPVRDATAVSIFMNSNERDTPRREEMDSQSGGMENKWTPGVIEKLTDRQTDWQHNIFGFREPVDTRGQIYQQL